MPLSSSELAALRQNYSQRSLRRAHLQADPIVQFQSWLDEAAGQELLEPNAMTLATIDASGQPWSRTVLLKGVDERGFTFYTNYEGAKGRQLEAEGRCALTFWWGPLERQVNVTGVASRIDPEESRDYFQSRPESSRIGAWASHQSETVADRGQLEQQFADERARWEGKEIELPPFWGGYRVRPETVEFWQGQRSRLHDRLRYLREGEGWRVERLSP